MKRLPRERVVLVVNGYLYYRQTQYTASEFSKIRITLVHTTLQLPLNVSSQPMTDGVESSLYLVSCGLGCNLVH